MNLSEEERKKRIEANRLRALNLRASRKLCTDTGNRQPMSNGFNTCNLKPDLNVSKLKSNAGTSLAISNCYVKDLSNNNPASTCDIKQRIKLNRQRALEKLNRKKETLSSDSLFSKSHTSVTSVNENTVSYFYRKSPMYSPITHRTKSDSFSIKRSTGTGTPALFTKQQKINQCIKGQVRLISSSRFEVVIQYHPVLVELFKQMHTKKYDALNRTWSFLLEDYHALMETVKSLGPDVALEPLPRAVVTSFSNQLKGNYAPASATEADLSSVDRDLVEALFPFQREGVNFGIRKSGRLLLADDMGLGKTIQSICLARYYHTDWPLLVVTPSSVRFDFSQQIKRWLPSLNAGDVNVITKGSDDCQSGQVVIVSYEIMSRQLEALRTRKFRIVIMDECHMLKNIKTSRTKAALQLIRQPWGWDFSGSSNLVELQLLLEQTLMLRRVKKDVLKQLPSKLRQVIQLDPAVIKDTKDLDKISSKLTSCRSLKGAQRRGILLEYFHQTGQAKLSAVRDYVRDVVDGGRKVLIFAHHREVLDSLEYLVQSLIDDNYIRIDGRTPSEQRKVLMDRFQLQTSTQVALLSITAANAGLNLSAAALVIFAELFWNPGTLVQAEDRVHRIGQEDSVNIHYLVAPGTADDFLWPLIQSKLDVLGQVGLSKDNFSNSHSTNLKHSEERTIEHYFKESFVEDIDDHDISTTESTSDGMAAKAEVGDFSPVFLMDNGDNGIAWDDKNDTDFDDSTEPLAKQRKT